MKIPIDWLKEYVNINKTPKEIAESFTSLGLLLDRPIENNVLDLEHRMDRSDWLSITGCARDLAVYENLELRLPELHKDKGKEGGGVEIVVEVPHLCRRFNTRVFKNITVKESPDWLKNRLEDYGMTSVNNIVDITNYVMIEFGNPLHAQDLDKFEKKEIVIRNARKDEKVVTLDGTEVSLDEEMFVLSQNNEAIVIGGVVGGLKTAVTEITKNIVLDAGNYDQANVRKTARKLKIQNETVLRYDKFLHPENTRIAIERATQLILELAGGEYYDNTDYYPQIVPLKQMILRLARIKAISGLDLELNKIKGILTSLEYKIFEEQEASFKLEVPYFRTDVEVEDDIVADILRINGYSKLPSRPLDKAPPVDITSEIYNYEDKLRDAMENLGLHEHITDPLVKRSEDVSHQVELDNALNTNKNAMRTSAKNTLYPVLQTYSKHGIKEIGVFEVGKIYEVNGNLDSYANYKETRVLTALFDPGNEPLSTSKIVKRTLSGLFLIMGISNITYENTSNGAKFYQNHLELGELSFDSFTIYTEKLLQAEKHNLRVVGDYQNKTFEDISITLETDKPFGPLYNEMLNFDPFINNIKIIDEYTDKDRGKKSILVRLEFLENRTSQEKIAEIKTRLKERLSNL
jgi:phenylalanyl-tRNA synthetase beta subunit